MKMIKTYFEGIHSILNEVFETQAEVMELTSQKMAANVAAHKNIFIFGCSHAGILAEEMFYRSGGLVVINPIMAPGLTLNVRPITLTSQIERLTGYGNKIIDSARVGEGDLLIIHSVSGRNPVPIDAALRAKELGAFTVALTNMRYSSAERSRHPNGKRLFEVCDAVIDNCGCVGDSFCETPGLPVKFAASSTVIGASILNAIMARAIELIVESGVTAPVFLSANLEGGDEHNAAVLEQYKDNIQYM